MNNIYLKIHFCHTPNVHDMASERFMWRRGACLLDLRDHNLLSLGILLGNLIAEDVIPASPETKAQLKGLKAMAVFHLGELAAHFDFDDTLNQVLLELQPLISLHYYL